jgi:hypothetical protein
MLFFINLIALGGGPVFTGWLIDHLATFSFSHLHTGGIWSTLTGSFSGGDVDFGVACPGGMAPKGSSPELMKQCSTTLARASQQGIIISICFYAWAAIHYALAGMGMVKHMQDRADAQAPK